MSEMEMGKAMARPRKCRRICREPEYNSFIPDKVLPDGEIMLTVDEYEAVRLIDLEGLTHEQCAGQMDISRTTVTELYESARYKIADSLVGGKRLQILGGNYRICDGTNAFCPKKCQKRKTGILLSEREEGKEPMKIAVTYENGEIFQHFGHTEQFKLYTVENGEIIEEQVVGTNGSGHGALAGFLKEAGADTLICGGIGAGAQYALKEAGIRLYGGVGGSADEAVRALLNGTLGYDPDVHCDHHDHEGEGHSCGHHGHEDGHGCGHHGHEGEGHTCGQHGCHGEA